MSPPGAPDAWSELLARRDAPGALPPGPLAALFGPVLAPAEALDGCRVIGRLAQTLDGRIATVTGSSQWIGGRGDLLHTHRLRALCHAVLVGAGTVRQDDPRLTTRLCPGPHPVRVILDTNRRLGPDYGVFREGPPTLLLTAEDAAGPERCGQAEVIRLPRGPEGGLTIPAILATLAARGLTRLFVEGGGVTVSRFLAAGCLDRLHVTVAPVLLGSGIPAFTLPEAARIADGLRFTWVVHPLEGDVLFDIPLHRARPEICR
ncbi:RibD family protein [Siccirubricoccus sp. KC 17139]|uniref:RibD family protein n=1 Tax=Siccirubricoccus soli TaxID=2899147 RepID=A0ABT1D4M6_9PROT|nr:RibD family protein [Siccirubricoccus soli]MCO6416887.1 RibD family protein [Siccirubricoccus soli]MCP2683022.1 RibD family protein [Siccirubricoccus soli]